MCARPQLALSAIPRAPALIGWPPSALRAVIAAISRRPLIRRGLNPPGFPDTKALYSGLGTQEGGKRKLEVGPMRTESVVLSVRSGPRALVRKGGLVPAARCARRGLRPRPALTHARGLRPLGHPRGSRPPLSHTARVRSRSVGAKGGLEPPQVLPHRLLRPARLPVPPLSRGGKDSGGSAVGQLRVATSSKASQTSSSTS